MNVDFRIAFLGRQVDSHAVSSTITVFLGIKMVICNTRILDGNLTGVQRYTLQLLTHLKEQVDLVSPSKPLHGIQGHIWEQLVLPSRVGKRLLWSPSNTGPLAVQHQVVSIMDVGPMDHPEWMNARFAAWYRFLTPRLVRRVRGILAISDFTKRRLISHCPDVESKIFVTRLAADARFVPISAALAERTRRKLGIPSPYYLIALGSLEPRKNLSRLLKAWAIIQPRIPSEVWLVLAGAKGKKIVFRDVSLDRLPPRVHLTGHVNDDILPALYSGALASVYLSLYEGFGLPPLEAMACGTPVLTSNVASLPEVVGDAAIAVDPYDIEAIAEGIKRLVDDAGLRKSLSHRGKQRAMHFNWNKTAATTWQILKQIAQS